MSESTAARYGREYREHTVVSLPDHGGPPLWQDLCAVTADGGHPLWAEVQALTAERNELRKDVEGLNQMLRQTGYGQGSIDAYVATCEELDVMTAERDDLRSQLETASTRADAFQGETNRLRKDAADAAALRQAFYDATQEAFTEIGKILGPDSRQTKAEQWFTALIRFLYEAVRDHEAGLQVLQELQQITDRRDELAVEFARLRRGDWSDLERAALTAERDELRDTLEFALEIIHGEDRLAELNARLATMKASGQCVPHPLIGLSEQVERLEAESDDLRRQLAAMAG